MRVICSHFHSFKLGESMKYPVAVWSIDGVYSAEVPDLPGVISEADSIEDLENSIKEAGFGWMECVLDENRSAPNPSNVEKYLNNPDFNGCLWLFVDFPIYELSDKVESKYYFAGKSTKKIR